jgi:hypothetical protein
MAGEVGRVEEKGMGQGDEGIELLKRACRRMGVDVGADM